MVTGYWEGRYPFDMRSDNIWNVSIAVIPSLPRDLHRMRQRADMKEYFVYMVTNKGRTTLYIGMTNSLVRRRSLGKLGMTRARNADALKWT